MQTETLMKKSPTHLAQQSRLLGTGQGGRKQPLNAGLLRGGSAGHITGHTPRNNAQQTSPLSAIGAKTNKTMGSTVSMGQPSCCVAAGWVPISSGGRCRRAMAAWTRSRMVSGSSSGH